MKIISVCAHLYKKMIKLISTIYVYIYAYERAQKHNRPSIF